MPAPIVTAFAAFSAAVMKLFSLLASIGRMLGSGLTHEIDVKGTERLS